MAELNAANAEKARLALGNRISNRRANEYLPEGCATHRALTGQDGLDGWSSTDMLLAATVDALHVANWQRGGDPKAPRPHRIPRPGVRDDDGGGARRHGRGTARPVEEIRARFSGQAK